MNYANSVLNKPILFYNYLFMLSFCKTMFTQLKIHLKIINLIKMNSFIATYIC